MGVTFRSGDYIRFVRLGGRTIKDGEAAAVWDRNGVHTQVIGPKRILLFYSTVRFLTRFKAETNQYLCIKHRDGTVEHVQGPISMYQNPCYHDSIAVFDGIQLKENEVLLVSHMPVGGGGAGGGGEPKETGDLEVAKTFRIVDGPKFFIPGPEDVVEQFKWTKFPKTLTPGAYDGDAFRVTHETLKLHTSTIWKVQVPLGSKARVGLAITFKIESIDKVLQHKDPPALLIAGLTTDAQSLTEMVTENQVKNDRAKVIEKLSPQTNYANLLAAAIRCGFTIESINLLGVEPGTAIQEELDREKKHQIETLTRVAKKESQIRFQELELEEDRRKMENQIGLSRKEAQMKAELAEEAFSQKVQAIDREIALAKKQRADTLDSRLEQDEAALKFLESLKGMGVDISKFMCAAGSGAMVSDTIRHAPSLQMISPEQKENDQTSKCVVVRMND